MAPWKAWLRTLPDRVIALPRWLLAAQAMPPPEDRWGVGEFLFRVAMVIVFSAMAGLYRAKIPGSFADDACATFGYAVPALLLVAGARFSARRSHPAIKRERTRRCALALVLLGGIVVEGRLALAAAAHDVIWDADCFHLVASFFSVFVGALLGSGGPYTPRVWGPGPVPICVRTGRPWKGDTSALWFEPVERSLRRFRARR